MKPQNVLDHDHYFASEELEESGSDRGRFDACLTRDDGAGVWSPESGRWYPQKDYEQAKLVAEAMATYYFEFYPVS